MRGDIPFNWANPSSGPQHLTFGPLALTLFGSSSALDTVSERRVQEALDQLVVSRTSLIVAHRLSTLRNVDRIVVFGSFYTVAAALVVA